MLSKKTQYAIYALMNLARNYQNGPVLIGDIASQEKLPKKFLESILIELKVLGVVNSKKGKGGGYFLISCPSQIDLATIIRNFDGALGLLPCATLMHNGKCTQCRDKEACGVRKVFKELRDMTATFLQNKTLADIMQEEILLQGKILN
jgi:Rrf2 family protein